jgi:septum site-determining protein MinC
MVARLDPAPSPGWPHRLQLGSWQAGADPYEAVHHALGADPPAGRVVLEAGLWPLQCSQLQAITQRLEQAGLELDGLTSNEPSTLVASAALGLPSQAEATAEPEELKRSGRELHVHRGTVRAGEHLEVDGAVLVLGDVNPGARISARGDVLIWGRLRGIAHAGCQGARNARIVALQLRPLQLRIADAVARGPEEPPPEGITEQARLEGDEIAISAAQLGIPISWG